MEFVLKTLPRGDRLIVLWLATQADPCNEAWDSAHDRIKRDLTAYKLTPRQAEGLVLTDGSAPNAHQRRVHAESLPGEGPLSVVTIALSNPIKRGIATAMQWANPQMRFFTPHQIHDAFTHARLTTDVDIVWDSLILMQSELGTRVRTLAMVAEILGRPIGTTLRPGGSSWH